MLYNVQRTIPAFVVWIFVWPIGLLRGERKAEMNATQIFAKFLDEKGVRYTVENECILSVNYSGDNALAIRIVFVFGEEGRDVAIRCFSVAKVPSEKLAKAYETCSKLNAKWRWLKFYVDSDSEVTVADDAIVEPTTLGAECFELMLRCVDIVDNAYPEIMGTIWGIGAGISAPQKR